MHKVLHPRDGVDIVYASRKEGRRRLISIEDSVDASIQRLEGGGARGVMVNEWRCPWCNGYRRRKWIRRHEFKSWTRLIAFHIVLIPLRNGMNPIILPLAMGK